MSDYQSEFGQDDLGGPGDSLDGTGATPRKPSRARKAIGTVEAVVAKTMGEPAARRVRDRAEATLGQAEAALGQAESVYRSARFRVDRELANEPYKTLGIAVGVGVVIGLLLARRERTIIYRPTH